jgi:hypothetical protein
MGICGACLLGHSYEELDTRIIHTIDSIRKLGVNIICRLGAEKKGKEKKCLQIFRRTSWETLAWKSNCKHHSTKFFLYKVFDFGDLDAGGSYSHIRVLLQGFSVRVDGNQEAKRK